MEANQPQGPVEIALVGDLTENQSDLFHALLDVQPGGPCVLYFDSPGGSPYVAIGLTSLILLRNLDATGVVVGECSSGALWPFAACRRRIVTPYSVLLFHRLRWQSDENVVLPEAAEWTRHFGRLEGDMDRLLARLLGISEAQLRRWNTPGRYMTGQELAEAGLVELADLEPLVLDARKRAPRPPKKKRRSRK